MQSYVIANDVGYSDLIAVAENDWAVHSALLNFLACHDRKICVLKWSELESYHEGLVYNHLITLGDSEVFQGEIKKELKKTHDYHETFVIKAETLDDKSVIEWITSDSYESKEIWTYYNDDTGGVDGWKRTFKR